MFKKNEVIFVGTKGICKIDDIKQNAFDGCDKSKEYYMLSPIQSSTNMTIFLPTDTPLKMRSLISKSKAQTILNNIRNIIFDSNTSDYDKFLIVNEISKDVDIENKIKSLNFLMDKKSNSNKKSFPPQYQKSINNIIDCLVQEISYVLGKENLIIREEILNQLQNKKEL